MADDTAVMDNVQEQPALSVHAPILSALDRDDQVSDLRDFIGGLRAHGAEAVARAESIRLRHYFRHLGAYLKKTIAENRVPSVGEGERWQLRQAVKPRMLCRAFNNLAVRTKNTMISEVIIGPMSARDEASRVDDIFGGENRKAFSTDYKYGEDKFSFGFVQVRTTGDKPSSTTVGYFLLSDDVMRLAASDALLREFQGVMNTVNHDMLHHLTSPIINPYTLQKYNDDASRAFNEWAWNRNIGFNYEDWAQTGHERVLLEGGGEEAEQDMKARVDRYFDELEKLCAEKGYNKKNKRKEYDRVTDYYGMTLAHALTRVFPLNHPVMDHCLSRMQALDKRGGELPALKADGAYREDRVFQDYKDQGVDLKAGDPYKARRIHELIRLSVDDVRPHAPKTGDQKNKWDGDMLAMARAAAMASGVYRDKGEEPLVLLYAEEHARNGALRIAEIPDGKGGKKVIRYTHTVSEGEKYDADKEQMLGQARRRDVNDLKREDVDPAILLYSADDAKSRGATYAEVPDGQGGRKIVEFTSRVFAGDHYHAALEKPVHEVMMRDLVLREDLKPVVLFYSDKAMAQGCPTYWMEVPDSAGGRKVVAYHWQDHSKEADVMRLYDDVKVVCESIKGDVAEARNDDIPRILLYSAAAERSGYPRQLAEVPDGAGGRKIVEYNWSVNLKGINHGWGDAEIVCEARRGDIKFVNKSDLEQVVLLYSAEAAREPLNVHRAQIPDGKGGFRTVEYTCCTSPEHIDNYIWKDKVVVAEVKKGDVKEVYSLSAKAKDLSEEFKRIFDRHAGKLGFFDKVFPKSRPVPKTDASSAGTKPPARS